MSRSVLLPLLLMPTLAQAHPLSRGNYSLRTALRVSDQKLDAIVILEIPTGVIADAIKSPIAQLGAAPTTEDRMNVLGEYKDAQFQALAAGLTLTVNGQSYGGRWLPRPSVYNGAASASDGFFMYIVEFHPETPLPTGDTLNVTLLNQTYPNAPMVYSAQVLPGTGWLVKSSSASEVLPNEPYDINDPKFWVEDPSLRNIKVTFEMEK